MPFVPFKWQVEFIYLIEKHTYVDLLKTRQIGATEAIACYFLWRACKNSAFTAAFISLSQNKSSDISNRIALMGSSVPGLEWETDSKLERKVKGGGTLFFRPCTENALRSMPSLSALCCDEAAFPPAMEKIYGSSVPALKMLGDKARIITCSTPNGRSCWFWQRMNNTGEKIEELCNQIRNQEIEPIQVRTKGKIAKIIAHWLGHEVYSKINNFLQKVKEEDDLTEEVVQREYNLGIDAGSANIFNNKLVRERAVGIFQSPQRHRTYIAGIDPNFGGKNNFALVIWDVTESPYRLVKEWGASQKSSAYCVDKAVQILRNYNTEVIAVETNGGGRVAMENIEKQLPGRKICGVHTSQSTKIERTDRIAFLMEQNREKSILYPKDSNFYTEALNFIQIGRYRQAAPGFSDDYLMGTATCFALLPEIENKPIAPL